MVGEAPKLKAGTEVDGPKPPNAGAGVEEVEEVVAPNENGEGAAVVVGAGAGGAGVVVEVVENEEVVVVAGFGAVLDAAGTSQEEWSKSSRSSPQSGQLPLDSATAATGTSTIGLSEAKRGSAKRESNFSSFFAAGAANAGAGVEVAGLEDSVDDSVSLGREVVGAANGEDVDAVKENGVEVDGVEDEVPNGESFVADVVAAGALKLKPVVVAGLLSSSFLIPKLNEGAGATAGVFVEEVVEEVVVVAGFAGEADCTGTSHDE